ncbi:hypothetical protein DL546_002803 [Coniochaeta pulveracea]|uniref:Ribosomal RNA-processing protein 14/surfeit locus protein 6 C-terminal domain-containing protein n=1 Tax=Coniochaeta pulveracea TaxID=177199 RepID=A0A420XZL1_9PEZI|nr:hypothetical protein DL546_002803 [Coniochaeta pulveracea]
MYYGEDTSDQWKKKKQTKAEAKAAKRNKLDPDSELNRNAKEVMDERAQNKRKLREMQEDNDDESQESQEEDGDDDLELDVEKEKPGEGLKKKVVDSDTEEKASKKVKLTAEDDDKDQETSKKEQEKAEKKALKKQKKEEKKQSRKSTEAVPETEEPAKDSVKDDEGQQPQPEESKRSKKSKDSVRPSTEEPEAVPSDTEMADISVPGLVEEDDASAAASSPHSPIFDTNNTSAEAEASTTTTSSINSAVAPSEKPKHIKVPTDTTALRARLAARIEQLRAARKADKEDGTPIRTRQELIEARREKQAQRKAHKKELRLKAKAEEDAKREEALASARNSPHLLSSPLVGLDGVDTNFSFGRVAFGDGTTLSRDLTYEKEAGHQKKKLDPKSALAKLEAQKKRLAELDEDKRKEILEKEAWLAARKRAEGEKVRDDEALLKKAVKRKDKAKQKSEKEWKERKAGVQKGIRERALKREANLKERAANKGGKGKKKSGPTKKKAGRPGFEGAGFGGKR